MTLQRYRVYETTSVLRVYEVTASSALEAHDATTPDTLVELGDERVERGPVVLLGPADGES